MSVYFVTGMLGAGKTLVTIGRLKKYFMLGRPIASNIDLNLPELVGNNNIKKSTYIRIPDKPTEHDMTSLGRGSDNVDENTYGCIVLDELGTWLNSRSWKDKDRQGFLNWCLHARKLGWDLYFIVQDIALIDKQLRDALCEHLVVCRRSDKTKIPILSMMKLHRARVYYSDTPVKTAQVDSWVYRGKDLYNAYDTRQVFSSDYSDGVYCSIQQQGEIKKVQTKEFVYLFLGIGSALLGQYLFSGSDNSEQLELKLQELTEKVNLTRGRREGAKATADSIDYYKPMSYLGSFGEYHFIKTSKGDFVTSDLVAMGWTFKSLSTCNILLKFNNESQMVYCDKSSHSEPVKVSSKATNLF